MSKEVGSTSCLFIFVRPAFFGTFASYDGAGIRLKERSGVGVMWVEIAWRCWFCMMCTMYCMWMWGEGQEGSTTAGEYPRGRVVEVGSEGG